MERNFEITVISAKDLEDVRHIFTMEVHARVTVGSDRRTEQRTPTDTHGAINPAWNYTMHYRLKESFIQQCGGMLVIKLYCSRLFGDRYVGEVHVSMKELYDNARHSQGSAVVDYPVQKGSVISRGSLKFSYTFGEVIYQ